MKIANRRLLFTLLPLIALMIAGAGLLRLPATFFKAAILNQSETGFSFWYLAPAEGVKTLEIPDRPGAPVEIPLGIMTPLPELKSAIDSIEFRFAGIPDFLALQGTATFPGFHVDVRKSEGSALETYDLAVFVTPEVFADEGTQPGAPSVDALGNLIEATDEVLRLQFTIAGQPVTDLAPISLAAIVTERNGDFTRHLADGNPEMPGNNPGTIELAVFDSDFPQIAAAYPTGMGKVALEFTQPVLPGSAVSGGENTDNYYIYKCGAHLPAPDPRDPHFEDAEGCQALTQESITEPGMPTSAVRDSDDMNRIILSLPAGKQFVAGAKYLVLVRNVGDESGSHFIPETGIYSQIFTWTAYPAVQTVVPMDADRIDLVFTEALCAASGLASPALTDNYRLIACDDGMTAESCIKDNIDLPDNPLVSAAAFDGNRTVVLTVSGQRSGVSYLLAVKNLQNGECQASSAIPADPAYVTPLFAGFDPEIAGAPLTLVPSESSTIHLPWREILELSPAGGKAPYSITVIPPEVGTVAYDPGTNKAVFSPLLVDANNQALQNERDAVIRITDYLGTQSELKVHILRRGDLGGRDERLLDKTDVQDVNDISAGWKR